MALGVSRLIREELSSVKYTTLLAIFVVGLLIMLPYASVNAGNSSMDVIKVYLVNIPGLVSVFDGGR